MFGKFFIPHISQWLTLYSSEFFDYLVGTLKLVIDIFKVSNAVKASGDIIAQASLFFQMY